MKRLQSSEPLHTKMNPTSCLFGLQFVRIVLSSYWLAHFYLMKKSTKVLHYSGLDCGMLEFLQIFFSQAVIQRTIVDFCIFGDRLAEKIEVCDHTTRDPKK
jgi:hypothetical protein